MAGRSCSWPLTSLQPCTRSLRDAPESAESRLPVAIRLRPVSRIRTPVGTMPTVVESLPTTVGGAVRRVHRFHGGTDDITLAGRIARRCDRIHDRTERMQGRAVDVRGVTTDREGRPDDIEAVLSAWKGVPQAVDRVRSIGFRGLEAVGASNDGGDPSTSFRVTGWREGVSPRLLRRSRAARGAGGGPPVAGAARRGQSAP